MTRRRSNLVSLLLASLLCGLTIAQDSPNQWTNPDGKVVIGEFVRLDGRSVVLRLETGKETKVPLSSLSFESHLQALKLAKPGEFTKELVKASAPVEPAKLTVKLLASDVINSPFDNDPSIDAFMQTAVREVNRGNFFVFWHTLPPRMQNDLSQLISKNMQSLGNGPLVQLRKALGSISNILATKRDWLFDSEVTGAPPIPPEQLEQINRDWPYIVAIVKDLSDSSLWQASNFTPQNVPQWLASVACCLQYAKQTEAFAQGEVGYSILSQSADRADVQLTFNGQPARVFALQKVGKTWVEPEMMNSLRQGVDAGLAAPSNAQAGAAISAAMLVALPVLSKLEQAKTKDEFKTTVEQIRDQVMSMVMSAGGPGGLGPGGFGPGGPGGQGGPGAPGGPPRIPGFNF